MPRRTNIGDGDGELHLQGDVTALMHIASGEETIARQFATSSTIAAATGILLLTYFVARKSETTTQVSIRTGGTAAAATPTLVRIGLYEVSDAGAGTLVASTPNDTALLAATFTTYTKAWSAAYAKRIGQRYALGILTVTAGATATFQGANAGSAFNATAPRIHGTLASQADLPASYADAGLGNTTSSGPVLGLILP